MKRLLFTVIVGIGLLMLLFLVFQTQVHRIKSTEEIDPEWQSLLIAEGAKALTSNDVPVGAIVLYNGDVIGKGFNTVYRDDNIAGHAEINAINDCIAEIGMDDFMKLDRSKLSLISTYEPCEMCKGMLVHYRILNIGFIKDKSMLRWIKNDRAATRYELSKTQVGEEAVQDSLFRLHPDYPGKGD